MNAIHKNSQEVFDLSYPRYYKRNSVYGLLIMSITKDIFFIEDAQDNSYTCVNDEFDLIF